MEDIFNKQYSTEAKQKTVCRKKLTLDGAVRKERR